LKGALEMVLLLKEKVEKNLKKKLCKEFFLLKMKKNSEIKFLSSWIGVDSLCQSISRKNKTQIFPHSKSDFLSKRDSLFIVKRNRISINDS